MVILPLNTVLLLAVKLACAILINDAEISNKYISFLIIYYMNASRLQGFRGIDVDGRW